MRTKITVKWEPGKIWYEKNDRLLTVINQDLGVCAIVRELPSGIAYIQNDFSMDGCKFGVIPDNERYHVLDAAQRVFEAYPAERTVNPGKVFFIV